MGVYIKGMEMPAAPTDGAARVIDAYVRVDTDGKAALYMDYDTFSWRAYQLVSVPQHGRLGDLDRLERMFADIDNAPYSGFDGEDPFYSADDAAQLIRLAPTIIPPEEGEV